MCEVKIIANNEPKGYVYVCVSVPLSYMCGFVVWAYMYRENVSELNVKGKLKKERLYLKGNLALQR